MDTCAILVDAFERIRAATHRAADGLPEDALAFRPGVDANSIAWLVWHITRIQDDHIADLRDAKQVWISDGWYERLGFPFPPTATGYNQTSAEVAFVRASARDLLGYYDAVHSETVAYVRTLGPDDLDRIVDRSWDPPVTQGVRIISVMSDNLQHAGQAAYVRGLIERGAS
ncbi:MAG: hypothetical protein QOE62_1380 [Actinomycetota bacterium]|nr:hypothetical protein [Actinomycetota bacterium]